MASLAQIASLERTIYNVQDRRNLFANIWKTFMGSTEDLELKKHNYVLLKLLNGGFFLEVSILPLKSVTFISISFCLLPCQVRISEHWFLSIHLAAVGLIHRKTIRWQTPAFTDITQALERWMGSIHRRDGARYCCPIYRLGTATYGDGRR